MEWIKCADRMPEKDTIVICCFEGDVFPGYWEDRIYKSIHWYHASMESLFDDPTHWMPLPPAPKESKQITRILCEDMVFKGGFKL